MDSREIKTILTAAFLLCGMCFAGCNYRKPALDASDYRNLTEYLDCTVLPDTSDVQFLPYGTFADCLPNINPDSTQYIITSEISELYNDGFYYNAIFCKSSFSPVLNEIMKYVNAFDRNVLPSQIMPYDGPFFISICDSTFTPKTPDFLSILYNSPNVLKDTVEINTGKNNIFICSQQVLSFKAKYCFRINGTLMLTNQCISDLFTEEVGVMAMEHELLVFDGGTFVWRFDCYDWQIKDYNLYFEDCSDFNFIYYPRKGIINVIPYGSD